MNIIIRGIETKNCVTVSARYELALAPALCARRCPPPFLRVSRPRSFSLTRAIAAPRNHLLRAASPQREFSV